jgi:hypothetical protein
MNAYEWAELAGEKEGEITTLRERLAECEKLLADIDEYGKIDAWDMHEIRARIGALLYRRTDSADEPQGRCMHCDGYGRLIQDCDWCDGHGNPETVSANEVTK